jgi:TatA/E family protein of Tat protein translocase
MGLGMGEVVLILVIALIVFGPRKLPELGKSLGQAMSQFRRASDDFKRTWEQEVEIDKVRGSNTASSSESNHSYNESYDPYNSYSDEPNNHETHPSSGDSHSKDASHETASTHNKAATESAAAGAEAAAVKAQPDKKHWI